MTHDDIDETRVGQHPMVSWFLKGVLRYLDQSPSNGGLTLTQLTHKLAMLMALANVDRCSDLVLDVTDSTERLMEYVSSLRL